MRKGMIWLAIAGLGIGTATVPASADHDPGGVILSLIEVARTDTVLDLGDPGDSAGDLLTFHNRIRWDDGELAGYDQGSCTRIHPAAGAWECEFTVDLVNTGTWTGRVAVAGSFFDEGTSVLAVTGGTGAFRHASGTVHIRSIDPTHFRLVFNIDG